MMFTDQTLPLTSVIRPSQTKPSHSSWPIWLVLLVTLSVAVFCVWKAERVQAATVPISQIRLGDRVPGKNPEGDVEDAPVLAELWRAVSIEATLQDGSRLELELLRPESWVRAHDLTVGAAVPVEFGETHTQSGAGKVKRINPCPPLRAGPGKIVTGLFRHATPEILTVSTADGERLNASAEHLFWSQDRQAFVPAKELQPGETSVVSVHPRPASETVYNLEVHGSHVFHVGQAGLLVDHGRTRFLSKADKLSAGLKPGPEQSWLVHVSRVHVSKVTGCEALKGHRKVVSSSVHDIERWRHLRFQPRAQRFEAGSVAAQLITAS